MATKKTTPSKKAAKSAAPKPAVKKTASKSTPAPKKKGKSVEDDDLELLSGEDEFKVDNEDMDMNIFSDSYDDDDDDY